MVAIPILSGIYTDNGPDFRTSYPVNFFAVPKDTGISQGYLRPASGIVAFGNGPGVDRGGIEWRGQCYRVMGSKLVIVSSGGGVTVLGDVGTDGGTVTLDYSFDRLCIRSAGNLFYWDGTALTQVTDPDLGRVNDMLWVDGYWMTTDGEFLVVTELIDPTAVDPLKYGSSEADPDPILAIRKIRNEVYALNRHTVEVFDNVGGELFPFARIEGAQIEKGTLGRDCTCVFMEALAFIGSGRNEQPSVYVGMNGQAQKISTHEIDLILEGYSEVQLAASVLEARNEGAHQFLYIHLPDKCLMYDAGASQDLGSPVWIILQSGLDDDGEYRAKFFTWCYNKWIVGDPQQARLGYLVDTSSHHWGDPVRWEFGTRVVYNEGRGAIVHELELVSLTGRVAFNADPLANLWILAGGFWDDGGVWDDSAFWNDSGITPEAAAAIASYRGPVITSSYSLDGFTWSNDRAVKVGTAGERQRRLVWFGQGFMRNWRVQRFRGTSDAHLSVARLEARLEPLAN